jgi:hypothetical protein
MGTMKERTEETTDNFEPAVAAEKNFVQTVTRFGERSPQAVIAGEQLKAAYQQVGFVSL